MSRIPSLRASDRLEEEEPTPSWHNVPKRQLRCIKDSGDLATRMSVVICFRFGESLPLQEQEKF